MYKLGLPKSEADFDDEEHIHARVYEILNPDSTHVRLFAGVPNGEPEVFERLVKCLKPPYFLLYILHTSRGEGEEGRYQSPELTPAEISDFIRDYRNFLSADGRFDLWGHSPDGKATVVWDRNNYIHAYGPIDRFIGVLAALGYLPGEVDRVANRTHTHHYRSTFDDQAQSVLKRYNWLRSDLHEEDKQ